MFTASNSSSFVNISGCTLANNEAANTITLPADVISATIVGNSILIASGVTGAGYVNTPTNLVDASNSKRTVSYTL
jgi:hypothetical protein